MRNKNLWELIQNTKIFIPKMHVKMSSAFLFRSQCVNRPWRTSIELESERCWWYRSDSDLVPTHCGLFTILRPGQNGHHFQTTFSNHFLPWKLLHFDSFSSKFPIDIWFTWCPGARQQAIIWTMMTPICVTRPRRITEMLPYIQNIPIYTTRYIVVGILWFCDGFIW